MAIADVQQAQPDIGYAPDYQKFVKRTQRRLETEKLSQTLPDGFPKKLESDLVWDNTDIADRYNWSYELSQSDLNELEAALRHFKSLGKSLGHVNQATFPLKELHAKLRGISDEIHNGFGFKVVRGLPVDKHSRKDIFTIYAGLASHIAPVRGRQDSQYQDQPADVVLNHIKDLSNVYDASQIGAPAYTTDKQVFHTDSGDIIALLCLAEAAEGGQSKVSSSWRVYNELAATRPDLIRTLTEEWPVELYVARLIKDMSTVEKIINMEYRFGDPQQAFVKRALLHYAPATSQEKERMIIQYARRTFTGFLGLPRSTKIPPITEAQAEALDALHFLAEKHALGLHFKKGDIQFVNNLSIFHARDGFTNTKEKQRHLVRLWLRDPANAWKTPEVLKGRWDKVYSGVGEGNEDKQVFPLEPYIRSASKGGK